VPTDPSPAPVAIDHGVAPSPTPLAAPSATPAKTLSSTAEPPRSDGQKGAATPPEVSRLEDTKGATIALPDQSRDLTAIPSAESLRKIGAFVVLPAEKEVNDAVFHLKKLKKEYVEAVSKRRSLEAKWADVSKQRAGLNKELDGVNVAIQGQLYGFDQKTASLAPENETAVRTRYMVWHHWVNVWRHSNVHGHPSTQLEKHFDEYVQIPIGVVPTGPQANAQNQPPDLLTLRTMIEAEIAKLPTPEQMEQSRQRVAKDIESRRDKLTRNAAHARALVSVVAKAYEALARDPKAKAIVDATNRGEKRAIKLGPSSDFRGNVKALEDVEKEHAPSPSA
jgi:hypothetical protein